MERIKQALERAREERDKIQGNAALKLAPADPVKVSQEEQPGAAPAKVVYTKTQRVVVPQQFLQNQRVITGSEAGPMLDAYRVLRTTVLHRLRAHGWNTLAVTSAGVGEGKTLTAINLAVSLAMDVNSTVLLVDADLRYPSLHRFFGLKPAHGLSDYLTRDVPIEQMLIHPGIDSLVLLPGGEPLPNAAELLGSPRMANLVQELKTRYASRIVVFDTAAVLPTAEALAFVPQVDAVLLVAEEGRTLSADIARTVALLKGTPVLGTVLNKVVGRRRNRARPAAS